MQRITRDTYVARQPIFNAKRQTLGYELLFRDGEKNAYPSHIESNRATYRLIVENFLSLGTNPAIDTSRCFINFPQESLIRGLPMVLPKDKVVIEVLETCTPNDELYLAVKKLSQAGYLIALDDFVYSAEWERFLPFVQIVKLDIMAMGLESACDFVKERIGKGVKRRFLAERVETEAEFLTTRSAGFSFFQGYFFGKPEITRKGYLSPEQLIAMELFKEVCQPEVDFVKIEKIVAKDVSLSYQLLRFVNTMSDRLEVSISSFRQALIYLGQDKLKIFVSLAVASFVSTRKPKELYNLSLQRAQFCQLMANDNPFNEYRDQAFLIGLFSMLDALIDVSLDELVEQLPLCSSIKLALLERQGPYGLLLKVEECYERADWYGIKEACHQLNVSVDDIMPKISAAQRWSQDINRVV
ncbi:EAL and HDOD domain-containing protein [Vibrio sinaloensis]|uniref:Histidine kinase n=1 Tax=Photobacterium sp. (strain ATCC 43367) TaxID=379097 RepID=A0A0A5HZW7_PHOS4|nr:EAL and HDOD domain-containing protein [Vibrio sinaloensis]KGY09034.1 histidine kinase [Vibrio sinaloensis]KHT47105.1 histidine kinase [Vibrio sinaloensis]KHT51283.1 histidine kinase [Vibrio sinaloensis]